MDLQKDSIRGEQTKRLLADPLLNEAFDTVAAALRSAWEATGEAQERERERLWLSPHCPKLSRPKQINLF